MKILIANLGSTSYKYCLYLIEENGEAKALSKGGFERVTDFEEVIIKSIQALQSEGFLAQGEEPDAVGFKTVLGKNLSGCIEANEKVLEALYGMENVAPAHNPTYANGIKMFAKTTKKAKLVALFETAFYQWADKEWTRYAIPSSWYEAGIKRNGFHGASHKFIAERSSELMQRPDVAQSVRNLYVNNGPDNFEGKKPLRVISCHLGGSSSVVGIKNGVAIGSSMGFSPQSGLPQNNRVGDLDAMAIPFAMSVLKLDLPEILKQLNTQSGLLGLSGNLSNDVRDIKQAATDGNENAQLAFDTLAYSVRSYIGSFMAQMGGIDAICFTAGIAENNPLLRKIILGSLEDLGVVLDDDKNENLKGEAQISADSSKVKVFVIPANEELVIAREVWRWMKKNTDIK